MIPDTGVTYIRFEHRLTIYRATQPPQFEPTLRSRAYPRPIRFSMPITPNGGDVNVEGPPRHFPASTSTPRT